MIDDCLFGLSKDLLLNLCLTSSFPGNSKYESNHPIWDCNVAGFLTPKEAWVDKSCLVKAVDNLISITNKSLFENKYLDFTQRVADSVLSLIDENNSSPILSEILNRFTVVKIAPKVTALNERQFVSIIKETKIDISRGVYAPMAGFGGIVRGSKKFTSDVEAYDINFNFCKYYGWNQRDALAQVVKTDKIVIACPPFGNKTERWKGTPDDMYYSFEEWCNLLKEYIVAPNYIFIGPELKESNKNQKCGLFRKKYGIQWYSEYSNL